MGRVLRTGPTPPGSPLPAGDVEDHPVAGQVVLDADVEVGAGGIEDAARPLRSLAGVRSTCRAQIVDRRHPDAAVAHRADVLSVRQTVPQVVVLARGDVVAVLVDQPVPAAGLVRDVHHRELRVPLGEQLRLRRRCVGARLGHRAVGHADRVPQRWS